MFYFYFNLIGQHICKYITCIIIMYFTKRDISKKNLTNLGIFSQGTKSGVFLRSRIPDIGVL